MHNFILAAVEWRIFMVDPVMQKWLQHPKYYGYTIPVEKLDSIKMW